MEKKLLVVCDLEVDYATQLMDYLSVKRNVPFEVYAFTDMDRFKEFARDREIDVLLASVEALYELRKEIDEFTIAQIFVLNEEGDIAEVDGKKSIYKYQKTENILREVMCYYAEAGSSIRSRFQLTEGMEMIAVYSPIKRSLKTSFAMTLGQILAENRRVLYINLEDYSGFNQIMKISYMTDMSDLLYYISQGKPNFMWKLASMVQSIGALDYIPPAISPLDITKITKEQWLSFFGELKKCGYDIIILDIGDCVNGIYDILRLCKIVYTPVRDDGISYAKLEQYEALLRIMEYEDVLEKTVKLSFSYFKGLERGLDRLVYSELGTYVRKLLEQTQNKDGQYEQLF